MGMVKTLALGRELAIAIGAAALLVHCGIFDDDEGRVHPLPAPDHPMSLIVAPSSLTTQLGGRVKTTVSVLCRTCVSGAPRVVELTAESAIIGFVSATAASQGSTLDAYVSPARVRLTFTPNAPTDSSDADVEIACEQIGRSRAIARFLDTDLEPKVVDVECTRPPEDAGGPQTREPKEFANGVGELVSVGRQGSAFTFAIGGVTSNFGERPKTLVEKFTPIDDDCERFEGATDFPSEKGPDVVSAETDLQKATATFDPRSMRYVWSGFQAGPLFGASAGVKFAWNGIEETVPAPPPFRTPAEVLSAPNGADTEFFVSPTEASSVTVFGQLAPGAGYTCRYLVNQLRVVSADRRAIKLVPPPVAQAIPDVMTKLQNVFVAQMNEKRTSELFPGKERSLDAARMLRIPRSALDP